MIRRASLQGHERMLQRLRAHPGLLARTTESIVNQEARGLCVEYGRATLPGPGLQDGGKVERFRKRVERDVAKVFAVRSNPRQVYRMLRVRDPKMAKAYWALHLAGKTRAMADIVRRAGLPQGLNPADHKKARVRIKGRVGVNPVPTSLATEAQLRAFVRKQRALVGFAKAGWFCAAKGVGGRVRRNIRTPGGSRGTAESFPKYVRTLGRRFTDAGGVRFRGTGQNYSVEIFTNVRHARAAMPIRLYNSVTSIAQEKLTRALDHASRELNRRQFGAA